MCHLYPYNNVKLLLKFFTLIFAVLLVGANFYMRPELNTNHSISGVTVKNIENMKDLGVNFD